MTPVVGKKISYRFDASAWTVGKRLALGLAVLSGLILGPVLHASETAAIGKTEVVDRIVAVVNEDIILLSEIEEWLKPYEKQILVRNLPPRTEQEMLYKARDEVIEERIDELLTAQKASALGIRVADAEVEAALERIKKTMLYTDEQLRRSLGEMGLSMETYREQIRSQIRRTKVLSQEVKSKIVVTEDDILKYYEAHSDRFASATRYHLRNIIMQPPTPGRRGEKEALLEEMSLIHQRLLEGASFEAMAREHSHSSFADRGGDLGLFELEDLSPQIRDAIEAIKPGEITSVLDTGIGLQIFYLEDIINYPGQEVDAVAEEIRQVIYEEKLDEKFNDWVTSLREDSYIRIIR